MIDVLIILATLVGLGVGGHYFVAGAAAIGKKCGMTPVVIGATIVALGTSLPEWAVSVFAASHGVTDLSVGNVVGSNICNICIILGLAAIVTPIEVQRTAVIRDSIIMLIATTLMIVFAADGSLGRYEGLALLLCAVITVIVIFRYGNEEVEAVEEFHWWRIPVTLAALALILVSSHFFVGSARNLAERLGVSPWIIGVTVAAIGTSLPELVTSLAAAWQRHTGMIIGNVIGSNIMNIFFVLGSAATIQTLDTSDFHLINALIFSVMMVAAVAFLLSGPRMKRWEGVVLLLIGLGWYALETRPKDPKASPNDKPAASAF
ncbi:MAG: calcium/sodium antiporter, partial [Pirellulales bacterium]|nr:calcium/sodium antiporter [Pirellulales bacterium]